MFYFLLTLLFSVTFIQASLKAMIKLMCLEGDTTVELEEFSLTRRKVALAICPSATPETVDFERGAETYAKVQRFLDDLSATAAHPNIVTFLEAYAPPRKSLLWLLTDGAFHLNDSGTRDERGVLNTLRGLSERNLQVDAKTLCEFLEAHRVKYVSKRLREDMRSSLRGVVDAVRLHYPAAAPMLEMVDLDVWRGKVDVALRWPDAPSIRTAMSVITDRLERLAGLFVASRGTHVQETLDSELEYLLNSVPVVDDVHFDVRVTFLLAVDTYTLLDDLISNIRR